MDMAAIQTFIMTTIQNYSVLPARGVERVAQLASFKTAVAAIPNISKSKPPEVDLIDLKPEGPQISVRPYTHNDHYWQVYFDTNAAIVKVCKAGWPIPSSLHQIRQIA